jgi:hypothetical protein
MTRALKTVEALPEARAQTLLPGGAAAGENGADGQDGQDGESDA